MKTPDLAINFAFFSVLFYPELLADDECKFSNHFAVQVDEQTEATRLAISLGFQNLIRVFDEENIFDFIHPNLSKCLNCSSDEYLQILQSHPKVKWVEQQAYRRQIIRRVIHGKQVEMPYAVRPTNSEYLRVPVARTKKSNIPDPPSSITFNDPFFKDQWYLHNEGQTGAPPGNDLNVVPAWGAGFSGRGITLSVLDDGLQHTNPDLHLNYEPSVSYNLVDFYSTSNKNDPMPDGKPENSHGTYCAGIIAAVANNNICGVGVAFRSKVGGIRILDGPVTDMQEALALSLALDKVDIYSASWGPQDDGKHVAGPGLLTSIAFSKGITQGRGGRGAIYVWAVGNGGSNHDNGNLDGYVASIYTLAVSALTDTGLSAYYSEPCACTLAATFVGGPHSIPSVDNPETLKDFQKIKVVVPELDGECMESFQGTSAAAPMAAGVIALVLEANPNLTWRDVQHVVVETARIPTAAEPGWQVNGAGYHFHLMSGFGVMDAARMVGLAQRWWPVAPMVTWDVELHGATSAIDEGENATVFFNVSKPPNSEGDISHLEYVVVAIEVRHRCRGALEIFVMSPAGTESQVLTLRPHDCTDEGFSRWGFMTVHFWGENPNGKWSVRAADHNHDSHHGHHHHHHHHQGPSIEVSSITLYGTNEPWLVDHLTDAAHLGKAFIPSSTQLTTLMQMETEVLRQNSSIKSLLREKNAFLTEKRCYHSHHPNSTSEKSQTLEVKETNEVTMDEQIGEDTLDSLVDAMESYLDKINFNYGRSNKIKESHR